MHPESGFRIAPNWPYIRKMTMTSQFAGMTACSNFFEFDLCLLSSLVTGPSFMSISPLVLEVWQFLFIRVWPEIQKLEIPLSEFGLPNLAWTFLIKCYWMLQNARVTTFTVSYSWKENQLGGNPPPPPPTQIRVN